MREFIVYFEVYGKKMKTTIWARSESEAKEAVKNKIVFYKVEDKDEEFADHLKSFFNGFKK